MTEASPKLLFRRKQSGKDPPAYAHGDLFELPRLRATQNAPSGPVR